MTFQRVIGRGALTALVLNNIIGSSIFGFPGTIAHDLGALSPLAMILGGLAIGIVMACAAEVASQFSEAGGFYLAARKAFGRLAGLLIAWFWMLAMLGGVAGGANLFVSYLAGLWPSANDPWIRGALLALMIAFPAFINYRGVRSGAMLSALLAVAKILPLLLILVLGFGKFDLTHVSVTAPAVAPGWTTWLTVMLLLISAYAGWEDALIPTGEVKEPRRAIPFALAAGLIVTIVLYTSVQLITVAALGTGASERPITDIAAILMGPLGATFVTIAVLLSTYGHIAACILAAPRLLYALAAAGDSPPALAKVHARFHTPARALVGFAITGWLLALSGTFRWALELAGGSVAILYCVACASLIQLRRMQPKTDALRIPLGPVLASIGIVLCLALLTQLDARQAMLMLLTGSIALASWLWARRRTLVGEQRRATSH